MSQRRRKTWREKLADDKDLPKVLEIRPEQERRWGRGRMVVPAPREVDAAIRRVRKGRVVSVNQLRAVLARDHGVDHACPITTGIFAWIAAHAAAEDEAEGRVRVTPWWRVVKEGGRLNPKFPGGVEEHGRRLVAEGHRIRDGRVVSG